MSQYNIKYYLIFGLGLVPFFIIFLFFLMVFGISYVMSFTLVFILLFLFKAISLGSIYYFVYTSSPFDASLRRLCISSLIFLGVSMIYGMNLPFFINNLPAIASIAFVSVLLGVILLVQTMSIYLNGMYSKEVTRNFVAIAILNLLVETPLVLVSFILAVSFFTDTQFIIIAIIAAVIYWCARVFLNYKVVRSTDLIYARNIKKNKSAKLSESSLDYSSKLTN